MPATKNQMRLGKCPQAKCRSVKCGRWLKIFPRIFDPGEQMGEVVQFIPKRDLERARLIQEARAIYESVFPTEKSVVGRPRGARE